MIMNYYLNPTFPTLRMRRLRENPTLRKMLTQTHLSPDCFIYPVFVKHGKNLRIPVRSMPNVFQFSIDQLILETQELINCGISAILIFGIPEKKDELASEAYDENGVVQTAIKILKKEFPQLYLITDVCLCGYTIHGHCGIIKSRPDGSWYVDNDRSLELLVKVAISHAYAGADMIAPSDMMDGRIKAIREGLDKAGYTHIPIMAYAVKFASSFYGPFREAAESAPQFGTRETYQLNPANNKEALREAAIDIMEGADIIMVKPALAYLDIIYQVKHTFGYPTAAYAVSGEYSMIIAAGQNGWIDTQAALWETHLAIRRAGADLIITYAAPFLCKKMKQFL